MMNLPSTQPNLGERKNKTLRSFKRLTCPLQLQCVFSSLQLQCVFSFLHPRLALRVFRNRVGLSELTNTVVVVVVDNRRRETAGGRMSYGSIDGGSFRTRNPFGGPSRQGYQPVGKKHTHAHCQTHTHTV